MSTEKKEAPGRDWGEVLADIGVGALRGYGQGGVRGAIVGGLVGGIEGDKAAKRQQLEMENARLRNEALKQDLQFGKNREERAVAAERRSEQASKRAEQSHAVSMQQANASLEAYRLNLYKAQAQAYGDEFYKGMTNKLNADGVDFADQNLLFNSTAFREAQDMWIAFKMYDNNPDAAVSLLKDIGWNVETDKDGKTWFYQDAPDGTRKRLEFNDATVRQIRDKVNKDFMDNYGTVIALGTPAASLNQASIKNVLTSKEVKSVYGDKLLDAGRDYKAFLQAGAKSKIFTPEDIAGHVMNRTLQSAIVDGKLSQEEMKILIPQFQLVLKKFGGEIIPSADGSIEKTLVKLKDGREISLKTLAQDLNERDIVWLKWNDQMKAKAVATEAAMIKRANAALDREIKLAGLEKKQLENAEKRQELGLPINGGGGGAADAGVPGGDAPVEWNSAEAKYYYDLGEATAKKYNIYIPDGATPEQITSIGVAFNAAENAKKKTGLNYYAEQAFAEIWKRSGKNFPSRNAQGGVFPFMTKKAREEDVAYLEKAIAKESDPVKKQQMMDLKIKIESSLKVPKLSKEKETERAGRTIEIEKHMHSPKEKPIFGEEGYFENHQKNLQQKAREYADDIGAA